MHTRTIVFTPDTQRHFARLYEGLVDGATVLRALTNREKAPKASDDQWERRALEVRVVRQFKAIGTPSTKKFLDDKSDEPELPVYELTGDVNVTLVLAEDEWKYACRCLRAAQWSTAIADEVDDAITLFERAAPDEAGV